MDEPAPGTIHVEVSTRYLEEHSLRLVNRHVFAYTIRVSNRGDTPVRLLERHWIITHANGKVEEIRGEGVIGEQPRLRPGESFEYTSGAILETTVGTMHGSYLWVREDTGRRFESPIPPFTLSIPRTLH